ncbi:MAG: VOC family protein [Alphaproteobacteria bacterium]|nr:MAG: VOC family protein [Alphaproteobacteria bacterium]
MAQRIALVSLLVADYDEAIAWYTEKLGFDLIEDTAEADKRWVVVAPCGGDGGCRILLAEAKNDAERAAIGNQTGGRVFLFLNTDDFGRDYRRMLDAGVPFVRGPVYEPYGTVAVFQDLYGNQWDLIEPC